MIAYEVEVNGLEEQLDRLGRFNVTADRELTTAMAQSVNAIVSAILPLAPVFRGRLRNSIGSQVLRGPGSVVGRVGSALRGEVYPAVMEFGRKPGRMPPPAALERWVQLVLRVPKKRVRGVAFLVARAIGRHGIKGRFYMKRGFEAARPAVEAFFRATVERIARGLSIGG